MRFYFPLTLVVVFLYSCSPALRIKKSAKENLLSNAALQKAHIGISIYEPANNKYVYNYQGDKYFVPASNVKIASCYAAMKYLGDSLKGIRYEKKDNDVLIVEGTGDPTLLHPEFNRQPVLDLLRSSKHVLINTENWEEKSLGYGWSWDDYNDEYMAERSPIPVYGNVVEWRKNEGMNVLAGSPSPADKNSLRSYPPFFKDSVIEAEEYGGETNAFSIERNVAYNRFLIKPDNDTFLSKKIPFVTSGFETARKLLRDTLKIDLRASYYKLENARYVFSHPTDSVLKIMMHRSDNFLAEQSLLMVSNDQLNNMNDQKIIDRLLNTDMNDLPQKPRWVDGSGLSRYNLFSPQDFVALLHKMQKEFGLRRVKEIFPTGNEGTLTNYYVKDSAFIYAKTGSLSGVVALSGLLYTAKNKLLLFSVLVNNHQASATEVRRAVEKFLESVRNKY